MLRITMNKSAASAKSYYSEHSSIEGRSLDSYYSGKDNFIGIWGGSASEKLNLAGEIRKEDFSSLCDNIDPDTGKQLTPRNNRDRRVGYDFTFDAGKSVSLAYAFGTDENKKEILDAFQNSVKDAMLEIESGMQTRVREGKKNESRNTGNLAYGEFVHFATRPIDGVPDPQLHAHCFAFNMTYDEQEKKIKAGDFSQIKKDAPYYEAVFHSSFADRLQKIGYQVEKTKNGFELQGIERSTIEKFSNRSKEIDELASKQNITDTKEKSALGAKTRKSKKSELEPEKVKENWKNRLTDQETKQIAELKKFSAPADEKKKEKAALAVQYSLDHHLERKSVTTDKEILTTAIKSSVGSATSEDIKIALQEHGSVIRVKNEITTKQALQEENELIKKAYDYKGQFKPINENYLFKNDTLTHEQKNAISYALSSRDGITIIAGKAGTGKTTLMKEVQTGILESDKQIFAFAPSSEASRVVQKKEGFENAETVAKLIQDKNLHEQLKNQVIWIDEAGTLSNRQMNQVLDIAKQQNARIILTGDTKQHNSVERGDALRTLQTEAGIKPVMVSQIQRQKNKNYKEATEYLSSGNYQKGFSKLDKMGAIQEIENHKERIEKVATDYFISSKQGETLVIAPTHAEGEKITDQIRNKLREGKVIDQEERQFEVFKNLQFTEAEKTKSENYQPGNYLIFHRAVKGGIQAGSKCEIEKTEDSLIHFKDGGSVSIDQAASYNVFQKKAISLSKGDRIRSTGRMQTLEGVHLFNGTQYQVTGFDNDGNVKLSNGSTLSKDAGLFNHGYVMTSHASQGKTVDKIIIAQSSISFRAASQEQFYVSVSRGRQAVSIYTDDKAELLQAVSKSSERKSAKELVKQKAVEVNRQNIFKQIKDKAIKTAEQVKQKIKMNYGI